MIANALKRSDGNINYPGLIAAWSAKGKTNDDEDRAILKDLTGNGHDITLNGFSFSGMSGYGGYNFINHNGKTVLNDVTNWQTLIETHTNKKVKFKISGIQSMKDSTNNTEGINVVKFTEDNDIAYLTKLDKDGEYELQSEYGFRLRCNGAPIQEGKHNEIIIEEIPEYKGALVFDGVDDYVSLDAFDSGFKTVFIECSYVSLNTILYDQRKVGTEQEDCINTSTYEAGFYGRNRYGKTYINGVYNKPDSTLIAGKLSNKHILITSIFKGDYTSTPCIASSNVNKGMYCNMALYKFLGFKEALTEEQIQAVIKKYNLLDGVDEIEIS
jgi:hypothetical protein